MASAVDVASIDVDVASIDVLDASAREAEALNAPAPEDEPPEEAAAARGPESAAAAATAVEASASPPAAPTISFSDEGSSSSSGTEYTRVPEDGPGPLAHHWQLEAPTEFTSPAAPSSSSGMEPEAPPRAATPAGGRDEAPETPAQKPVDREALSACLFDIEAELQCSICCSLVSNAAATPCGHIFCRGCIRRWLRQKRSCPNCQRALRLHDGVVEVPTIDHIVARVIDASPRHTEKKESVERRRQRLSESGSLPSGFVTAAALLQSAHLEDPAPEAARAFDDVLLTDGTSPASAELRRIHASMAALEAEGRQRLATLDAMEGRVWAAAGRGLTTSTPPTPSTPRTLSTPRSRQPPPARPSSSGSRPGSDRVSLIERQRVTAARALLRRQSVMSPSSTTFRRWQ